MLERSLRSGNVSQIEEAKQTAKEKFDSELQMKLKESAKMQSKQLVSPH